MEKNTKNKIRQHISVLVLLAGSSMKRLLLVLVGMLLAEGVVFLKVLNEMLANEAERATGVIYANGRGPAFSLETVFENSHIAGGFSIALILFTIVLCSVGCEKGNKQGYTLKRLGVSEKGIFLLQSAYNVAAYFILWGVQLAAVLVMCNIFLKEAPENAVSNQTVFLAFYRNDFLHSLLPLSEVIRWIRNILLFVGMGIAAAGFPFRQRRGGWGPEIVVLGIFALIYFVNETGTIGTDFSLIIGSIGIAVMTISKVVSTEKE